jgi:hypothetical protein
MTNEPVVAPNRSYKVSRTKSTSTSTGIRARAMLWLLPCLPCLFNGTQSEIHATTAGTMCACSCFMLQCRNYLFLVAQNDTDEDGSKLAFQPAARFGPVMDQVHDDLVAR